MCIARSSYNAGYSLQTNHFRIYKSILNFGNTILIESRRLLGADRYRALKSIIHISITFLLLCSCSDRENSQGPETKKLPEGKYYAKYWRHTDTIVFKPYNSEILIGGWTELFWTITKDSIFQEDTRGLTYSLYEEKCTYLIQYDTLSLLFRKSDQSNKRHSKGGDIKEKYKIAFFNDTVIKLVRSPLDPETLNKIGRGNGDDIQLR